MSSVFQIPTELKLLPVAQSLAKSLEHQKIVFLEGGLGAGKTTFIRYLLEAISDQYKSSFEFQGSPTYIGLAFGGQIKVEKARVKRGDLNPLVAKARRPFADVFQRVERGVVPGELRQKQRGSFDG